MAKGIKTGGRKKGVPNKATAAKAVEIAASGLTPLEYMLDVMRNPGLDCEIRMEAAKAAAPYVHPKLAQVEHTGKDGGAIEMRNMSDLELARGMLWVLEKAQRAEPSGDRGQQSAGRRH